MAILVYQIECLIKLITSSFKIRNYSQYPLYSLEEIEEASDQAKEAQRNHRYKDILYKDLTVKEEGEGAKLPKDFSEEYWTARKESLHSYLEAQHEWKKVKSMIESNLAIIGGRKTIEQAEHDFVEKFLMTDPDINGQVESRYKKWLQSKS